jgi:hypothetical protein
MPRENACAPNAPIGAATAATAPPRSKARRSSSLFGFASVDMFTPISGMAPPCTHCAWRAAHRIFEALVCRRTFRRLFAIECDAQIMRRDRRIVNEMEFRMSCAWQGLSPRSHHATMKRFS